MNLISSFRSTYGNHPSQFGVLRVPEGTQRAPVVVSVHGGFWQSEYGLELHDRLAEDLVRRGYAVWNIEYRRVGEDGGGWTGTFHDVIDAVNHLSQLEKRFSLDLSRVIVLGHSAGGHLALWLASRIGKVQLGELGDKLDVPIHGVISLAGVSDLRRMWETHVKQGRGHIVESLIGGTPQEVPERYRRASPIELLPLHVDQVLIHGEQDRNVPVELSIEYHRMAVEHGDGVRLVLLPDAEHFQVIDPSSSAWNSVAESIEAFMH